MAKAGAAKASEDAASAAIPGPGAYRTTSSVGFQHSSSHQTQPAFGFGSSNREHAAKLYGYLPPGTLLDQKDLEFFPEDLREEIQQGLASGDWHNGRKAKHGIKQPIHSYTIF